MLDAMLDLLLGLFSRKMGGGSARSRVFGIAESSEAFSRIEPVLGRDKCSDGGYREWKQLYKSYNMS